MKRSTAHLQTPAIRRKRAKAIRAAHAAKRKLKRAALPFNPDEPVSKTSPSPSSNPKLLELVLRQQATIERLLALLESHL